MRTVHLGFGANAGEPADRLEAVLASLQSAGVLPVVAARPVLGPFVGADGAVVPEGRPVLNTVIEAATELDPRSLLERLAALESDAGRVRDGGTERALDLDLLAYGDRIVDEPDLQVPHPRALDRAFVLRPWAEIAPGFVVPGTGAPVIAHAAALRAAQPGAFAVLESARSPRMPDLDGPAVVLEDRQALDAWRAAQTGLVGVVPTMGALHAGHLSLVRRVRAAAQAVAVTLFVNPLQFGPDEDLDRYPRTLEADLALLRRHGVDAVYVPAPRDLYPADFSTYVVPEGPARAYEGASRPGHFRGVATVVTKLLQRTRPDLACFGCKDAQQVAVVERLVRDLDLSGRVVVGPTIRDPDGLALSSRNRYLDGAARARALALPRALGAIVDAAARGVTSRDALATAGRAVLDDARVRVDYLDVVDAATFEPVEQLARPALAIGALWVDDVHLIDNEWIAPPA